jgi:hypothetical protein
MTTLETLQKHLQVCDELYQLALEENRHLKEQRRPAEATLLDRKRALLEQLDKTLTSLRSSNATGEAGRETRPLVEKLRGRILQILQLDKENEQLLLRASLSRGIEPVAPPAPGTALLQKIYGRTAS